MRCDNMRVAGLAATETALNGLAESLQSPCSIDVSDIV